MDIYVLDQAFNMTGIIDTYVSFIWTERYIGYGDFEILMPINIDVFSYIQQNNYVRIEGTDVTMIIEEIEVNTSSEDGILLKISGRSLESILDRRIVWQQTTVSGDFQNGISKLFNENIINPIGDTRTIREARSISNFVFQRTEDEYISELVLNAQYTGDNLYDILIDLCQKIGIGFKIILSNEKKFVFSFYNGIDRSIDQNVNPFVIFSPITDNLISSQYIESYKLFKNVTLVLGEGEGLERQREVVGNAEGLLRRELYTDARDIQSKIDDNTELDPNGTQYHQMLAQRGNEKLAECMDVATFDGEINHRVMFEYKKDYDIGDIVQIENELGIKFKVRIEEMVRSIDDTGYNFYPNFSVVS